VIGKLAIFVLGVAIGSSWLTDRQAASVPVCVDSAPGSKSAPAQSDQEDHDDSMDKLRVVGGELWHRIVQPMVASAAAHTLDALMDLLRNAADHAQSDGRSHASLDPKAPAARPRARE
jgi:hypothetical protein